MERACDISTVTHNDWLQFDFSRANANGKHSARSNVWIAWKWVWLEISRPFNTTFGQTVSIHMLCVRWDKRFRASTVYACYEIYTCMYEKKKSVSLVRHAQDAQHKNLPTIAIITHLNAETNGRTLVQRKVYKYCQYCLLSIVRDWTTFLDAQYLWNYFWKFDYRWNGYSDCITATYFHALLEAATMWKLFNMAQCVFWHVPGYNSETKMNGML